MVLEKTLENPLDCKEIQPVNPKGNQSEIFIGRTDFEAETPKLCPPDVKNWLIAKYPPAGKYWRQEEKGTTEDEMVGWHHQFNGHEFELALGVGDGQGSLACCSPWGCKELDMTEQLNWTELVELEVAILLSKNLSFSTCKMKCKDAKSFLSCPTLFNPRDWSPPAPLFVEFSRQEYWSGLLCPPPGDLPYLGIELKSLMSSALASKFFTASATWEACKMEY